ncbi:secreted protein [Bordetella ansorpii]|uniref:Secreted protein n=1 Tax=Bordetella ansorpii TaxID=288768 RepID=A0A157NVI4_9BORD|nr:hypothetical protein [Bordetella ansorpii]SAI25201.1 secreted protein [Bordetella ansorpii]
MNNFAVGGAGQVGSTSLSSMDLETALMAVQSQRSQLLESSLRSQMESVNAKNQQIADLNNKIAGNQTQANDLDAQNVQLTADNAAAKTQIGTLDAQSVSLDTQIAGLKDLQSRLAASKCPDPEGYYGLSWGQGDNAAQSHQTLQQVRDAGLTVASSGPDAPQDVDRNGTMDAKGRVVQGWVNELNGKISALESQKAAAASQVATLTQTIAGNETTIASNTTQAQELRAGMDDLKRQVDGISNSQQMEMLRLQSLANKNNEAFEVMTNFIKKMQDSRSSIIGNMR